MLDAAALGALGEAQAPVAVPASRAAQLRAKVMNRIQPPKSPAAVDFLTVAAAQGEWIQILPKVEKKSLAIDAVTGAETYLLRAKPGAEAPAHTHEFDEVCVMLEGDVAFDNIKLRKGDYHLAKKGTTHGRARTDTGALIFLQDIPAPA